MWRSFTVRGQYLFIKNLSRKLVERKQNYFTLKSILKIQKLVVSHIELIRWEKKVTSSSTCLPRNDQLLSVRYRKFQEMTSCLVLGTVSSKK